MKEKQRTAATRRKKDIQGMWKSKLNNRKQAFFSYHRAKPTAETYEQLLANSPPRMPRKFLPKEIPNEDPEETEIRKNLSIEKFKSQITLLKIRARRNERKYIQLDTDMLKFLTDS